jgi:putative inorganic carbon (hco3(-)) transporter
MKQASKAQIKAQAKAQAKKTQAKRDNPVNIIFGLVILAYILITTFTPNLEAFDTNAPKFMAMAMINLLAFIILLADRQVRQQPSTLGYFFKTGAGLVYSGFIVVSILSMFNAINLTESVVQLVKAFTVFSSVFIISAILMRDLRYLEWLVILVTGLLLFDAFSVFYNINEYIRGDIAGIVDIKTIYSNKNILASAIFVKLPFAIWLMMFRKGWLKAMGWLALATGITATFFMATRAFYMGLVALTVIFLGYLMIDYLRKKQKTRLYLAGYYLGALLIAYLAFTGTHQYLYPKSNADRLTLGVGQQLATVKRSDPSLNARFQSWKWSMDLLMEKPLLGVGTGNWKAVITKYENKVKPDFEYLYKAHNDFIETTAETGLAGGLLYIGIFAMMAWAFLKMVFKGGNEEDELFRYMFLATSGLVFYSVDAFFNFPADRPEIQILFSIFLGTGIAVIHHLKMRRGQETPAEKPVKANSRFLWPAASLVIILMAAMIWIFNLNFISSKTQRIVFEEIKSGRLRSSSEKILAGFPSIPNLTILGEPVNVQRARYLLNEGKNEQAIALLRNDQSSPWDGRREYFMSMGFSNLNMPDSSLAYSEKLRLIKPNHHKNTMILCQMLEKKKENEKLAEYLDDFLATNKDYNQAWVYAAGFYDRNGNIDKAWEVIEEGKKYLPADTLVEQEYNYIYQRKFVDRYRADYNRSVEEMNAKNYASALAYINKFIENVPGNFDAHRRRAYIYYYMNKYTESIGEISYALTLSGDTGAIINLRGVCYHALKDLESACRDFEQSMRLGDKDGMSNYERFCKSQ